MSIVPSNDTWKKQQKHLVRSTFKKATVIAVNKSANTLDISFVENPQTVLRGIPLARCMPIADVMVGQRCRVDLFDETNPSDMVVAYSY